MGLLGVGDEVGYKAAVEITTSIDSLSGNIDNVGDFRFNLGGADSAQKAQKGRFALFFCLKRIFPLKCAE